MRITVVVCSTRSARGERADTTGPVLVEALRADGHDVSGPVVVADELELIRDTVRAAVEADADAVITTGGTGVGPGDVTPEAVAPLIERDIPGIAEALRAVSRDRVPTSVLSRGVSGLIGRCLVVTLPGSSGGVRDGLAVLQPLLVHVHEQVSGVGDHRPGGGV